MSSLPETSTAKKMVAQKIIAQCCVVVCGLIIFFGISGCNGYMIGAPYRQDVQTIHVPIFTSTSFRRDVELQLTEAVHKEIQNQTHFRLVKADIADTQLTGEIIGINKGVLGESAFDDARELQLSMTVRVAWTDLRTNRTKHQNIPMTPETVTLLSTADFAPEIGQSMATARHQAVQRLARQIVRMMQYPW